MWRSVVHFVYNNYVPWDVQVVDVDASYQWAGGGTANGHVMGLSHAQCFGYHCVGPTDFGYAWLYGAGSEAWMHGGALTDFVRYLFNANNTGAWFNLRGDEVPTAYTYTKTGVSRSN